MSLYTWQSCANTVCQSFLQERAEETGSFRVRRTLEEFFDDGIAASALFNGVSCWGSEHTDRNRKRIDKVVRRSGSVLGCSQQSETVLGERRMLMKLESFMDDPLHHYHHHHPLHQTSAAH